MLLLQVLFFIIIFIIGVIKIIINLSRKEKVSKLGLAFVIVPVLIAGYLFVYHIVSDKYFVKPTQTELAGHYHVTDATISGFDEFTYKDYVLILNRDSTFTLTKTPYIDICGSGKYEVDYSFEYNEISFRCDKTISSAHIDGHLNYYRIEFIIGDPDTGESIFFEKDK